MGGKKNSKNKYKKEYYIVITILGILLAGLVIGIGIQTSKPYTLAKVINEFNKLDKKYNTSWRQEKIGGMVVSIDKIDDYLEGLDKVEEGINKKSKIEESGLSDTKTLMLNLTQARRAMLEAERKYQEFLKLDDKGRVAFLVKGINIFINDSEPIDCRNKEIMLKGAQLLNQSLKEAHKATRLLDFILQNSEESKSPQFIGINNQKLEFYNADLGILVKTQMDINLLVIKKFC